MELNKTDYEQILASLENQKKGAEINLFMAELDIAHIKKCLTEITSKASEKKENTLTQHAVVG